MVGDLDRLRAAHIVAEQWLLAVENRLEGPAHYLLEDELQEQVEVHREAAAALAERVAELDGAITGDPTSLLELGGLGLFELPADTSDPTAITGYALDAEARAPTGGDALRGLDIAKRPRDVRSQDRTGRDHVSA